MLRVLSAGGGEAVPGLQRRQPPRQQCRSPPAGIRLPRLEGSASLEGREGKNFAAVPGGREVWDTGGAAVARWRHGRGAAAGWEPREGCGGAGLPLPSPRPVAPFGGLQGASLPPRSFESLPEPDGVTEIVPKPRRSASRDFSQSDFFDTLILRDKDWNILGTPDFQKMFFLIGLHVEALTKYLTLIMLL